jgi:N-acetylglucosamine kinase-like BadF-type ATPase
LGGNAFDNISTIYKKGSPYIAGFARYVLQAAGAGDSSAMEILRENAERLSMLIRGAIHSHGMPSQLIATGDFLSHNMFRELVEQYAGVRLTIPENPSVYGACVEALRAERLSVPEEFAQNFTETYRMAGC